MEYQLAYNIAEACAAARIGRTTLYEAIKNGSLRAVKRGARTLILTEDLRNWIAGTPGKKSRSGSIARSWHKQEKASNNERKTKPGTTT